MGDLLDNSQQSYQVKMWPLIFAAVLLMIPTVIHISGTPPVQMWFGAFHSFVTFCIILYTYWFLTPETDPTQKEGNSYWFWFLTPETDPAQKEGNLQMEDWRYCCSFYLLLSLALNITQFTLYYKNTRTQRRREDEWSSAKFALSVHENSADKTEPAWSQIKSSLKCKIYELDQMIVECTNFTTDLFQYTFPLQAVIFVIGSMVIWWWFEVRPANKLQCANTPTDIKSLGQRSRYILMREFDTTLCELQLGTMVNTTLSDEEENFNLLRDLNVFIQDYTIWERNYYHTVGSEAIKISYTYDTQVKYTCIVLQCEEKSTQMFPHVLDECEENISTRPRSEPDEMPHQHPLDHPQFRGVFDRYFKENIKTCADKSHTNLLWWMVIVIGVVAQISGYTYTSSHWPTIKMHLDNVWKWTVAAVFFIGWSILRYGRYLVFLLLPLIIDVLACLAPFAYSYFMYFYSYMWEIWSWEYLNIIVVLGACLLVVLVVLVLFRVQKDFWLYAQSWVPDDPDNTVLNAAPSGPFTDDPAPAAAPSGVFTGTRSGANRT